MKTITGLTIVQDGKRINVTSEKTTNDTNYETSLTMSNESVIEKMDRVLNITRWILLGLFLILLFTFVFKLLF